MEYPEAQDFETTLSSVCLREFFNSPDRVILRYLNDQRIETWSISDIMQRALTYVDQLRAEAIEPGAVIAVMLENHPDHVAVMIALGLTGTVWLPLNSRFTASNVRRVLTQVDTSIVIAEHKYADVVREAGFTGKFIARSSINDQTECSSETVKNHLLSSISNTSSTPNDVRALLFTSGTTGPPKGVIVTERMYIAAAKFCGYASEADQQSVFYLWEPLNHIGGAQIVPMALLSGCTIAMSRKFSVSRFWSEVSETRATRIHYLGGVLELLLRHSPSELDKKHKVTLGFGAGASEHVSRAFTDRFGIPLREVYGMTEASSFSTINFDSPLSSIGKTLPDFDLKLVDKNAQTVAVGEIGEITLKPTRCALVTPNYYQNQSATESAFRNGYFHTGDLAYQDASGNLYFIGRKTEQIRCKGENISPWEVESVFKQHPAVLEVAVVGVDSDITEQDIAAFIRLAKMTVDQHGVTTNEIRRLLSNELAQFQQPRYIVELSEFPKTPSERIEKHKLDCSAEMLKKSW